jgi:hypothetical protein
MLWTRHTLVRCLCTRRCILSLSGHEGGNSVVAVRKTDEPRTRKSKQIPSQDEQRRRGQPPKPREQDAGESASIHDLDAGDRGQPSMSVKRKVTVPEGRSAITRSTDAVCRASGRLSHGGTGIRPEASRLIIPLVPASRFRYQRPTGDPASQQRRGFRVGRLVTRPPWKLLCQDTNTLKQKSRGPHSGTTDVVADRPEHSQVSFISRSAGQEQ